MNTKKPARKGESACVGKDTNPGRAKILVVDDHAIVREGLARVIESTADLVMCGQAETTDQALKLIPRVSPALAIIDISLNGSNGVELIKEIKFRHPELLMLVHSMHDETIYAERCLRAGAKGYVMKQETAEKLLCGIRALLKGKNFISDNMTNLLINRISTKAADKENTPEELLSDRELEVFRLLGQGLRTKEVAQRLRLSEKTIQTYREHIKEKLALRDAVALVHSAVQWVESQP